MLFVHSPAPIERSLHATTVQVLYLAWEKEKAFSTLSILWSPGQVLPLSQRIYSLSFPDSECCNYYYSTQWLPIFDIRNIFSIERFHKSHSHSLGIPGARALNTTYTLIISTSSLNSSYTCLFNVSTWILSDRYLKHSHIQNKIDLHLQTYPYPCPIAPISVKCATFPQLVMLKNLGAILYFSFPHTPHLIHQ